jgi:hypothetical protein
VGLKHLKPAVATIETSDGDIVVRGLSFADISLIVSQHRESLSALFDRVKSGGGSIDLENSTALLSSMVTAAPDAAAQIIALAADEEDVSLAMDLVFPVQLEVLEAVAKLTFSSEGGLKKVVETIVRVAQGATSAMQALKA